MPDNDMIIRGIKKMMDYNEAMQSLQLLDKFGIHLGLERIKKLLLNMGNPQDKLKFIHIAGTNGKGSASTMIANILTAAGYRTGLFTSPYVISFLETYKIDGEMIPENEFAECTEFVLNKAKISDVDGEYPTKFEVMTAIAFEWFYRRKCDYVCLETGMGGKEDSTNVIQAPLLQVIMSISLDHVGVLGNNLKEIAEQKAGIIKGGTTVIYPLQDEDVFEVIEKKCNDTNGKYIIPDIKKLEHTEMRNDFVYKGGKYVKSLLGEIQVYNCITAIEAAIQLRKLGLHISDENISSAVHDTVLPARTEVLSEKPFVFIDGSHNPDGAKALAQVLDKIKKKKTGRMRMIMGVLADKDYKQIIKLIVPYASDFIAVSPNNVRALPAEKLCAQAKAYCSSACYTQDFNEAVSKAFEGLDENDAIIVCGSLYLSADMRPLLIDFLKENRI